MEGGRVSFDELLVWAYSEPFAHAYWPLHIKNVILTAAGGSVSARTSRARSTGAIVRGWGIARRAQAIGRKS